MKKKLFYAVFFQVTLFFLSPVWGDVIELDNGSKIVGQIENILKGKLEIKTDFAGKLTIDMARVVSLSSKTPLLINLTSGNRLYGTIHHDKEKTRIDTPDGSISLKKGALVAAWQKGQPDPLEPKRRKWKYAAGFDISGRTGNTERTSVGGRVKAKLEGPKDHLLFYLRGTYAREDGDKTDDEIIGGIDFEAMIDKQQSWYARVELENDDIEELDLRSTAAAGYGYYFFKRSDHVLRGRAGLMYRHESYSIGDDNSTAGLDLGLYHMYKFDDWGKLITDIVYTPSFEDFGDYRVFHESAFEVPLARSDIWKLKFGVTNEYNSDPVADKERLDTTYFSRLVLTWD